MLEETWAQGGRRYYRYSADAPIANRYAIFSAAFNWSIFRDQLANPNGVLR